jgi:uncharacterized tellurite resistance protein B-like protein
MDIRQFYIAMGKLLYAIADADSVITRQERNELYKLISTRLTHRELHTDEFGTNDAWYTVFEFEAAEEAGLTANEAFNEFAEYIQEHWAMMDDELRSICMLLADRLAESYHHTNAREKDMIRRLRDLLYTIHPLHSVKN